MRPTRPNNATTYRLAEGCKAKIDKPLNKRASPEDLVYVSDDGESESSSTPVSRVSAKIKSAFDPPGARSAKSNDAVTAELAQELHNDKAARMGQSPKAAAGGGPAKAAGGSVRLMSLATGVM